MVARRSPWGEPLSAAVDTQPATDALQAPTAAAVVACAGGVQVMDHPEALDQRIMREHASAFAVIDELEVAIMQNLPAVELPLEHHFTPGLYTRTIHIPAGTILTSKIHRTEHPFVVHKGRLLVVDDDNGPVEIAAPHMGITKPGTRRVVKALEDCVWSTFHAIGEMGIGDLAGLTQDEKLERIEAAIIIKHDQHRAGLVQPPAPAAPAIEQGGGE